jgi:large subunit ribosomal protein L19
MKTNIKTTPLVDFTPVNQEERKELGIKAGDTVRVWVKIQEKGKIRLQAFEGLILAAKHGNEPGATFTVRKVSNGVGVERIFPLFSPNIDKIEIVKRARVRRAKLYHIREMVAREVKRQMRRTRLMNLSTLSDTEETERIRKEEEAIVKAEEDRIAKEAEDKAAAEAKAAEEQAAAEAPEEIATEETENTAETTVEEAAAMEDPETTTDAVEAVQEVANNSETVEEKKEKEEEKKEEA